jgi:hypothetical protein
MNTLGDERLTTLTEIANDYIGVDSLSRAAMQPESRVLISRTDLLRALESAYDVGLVVGCRLGQIPRTKS